MLRPFGKLLEEQGGAGGTGGGDGGTAAASLTEDQINQIISKAVTAHLGKALPKAIETAMGKIQSALDEKLATLKPIESEASGGGHQPTEAEKKIAELEKRNLQLAKNAEEFEKRSKEAENKTRTDRALATMRSHLTGKVKPEFVDIVANHLHKVEERLQFGDDGMPMLKVGVSSYKGAPPEDTLFMLEDGLSEWLKSPAAAVFIPAPTPTKGAPVAGKFSSLGVQRGAIPAATGQPKTLEEVAAAFPDLNFNDFA
jgi:hypothetical protein